MKQKGISSICPTAVKLTSLKVLNLSFNCISRIENLPPNLEELYLNGNQVDHIALNLNKPINSMYHLGLSRNKVRQTALSQIVKIFPNLFCLDLSFNELCEIDSTIAWIKNLSSLKMLSLEGNPLILTANYQKIMVERMPNIKVLDSVTIPADQRRAAEQAMKEREQKWSSTPTKDICTPILNQISIDLSFRVLRNINNGRYLIPDENCTLEVEKLDAIPQEFKSSVYWVTYQNHFGTEVCT